MGFDGKRQRSPAKNGQVVEPQEPTSLIANFSQWSNLLDILYKQSYWYVYVVHILIENQIHVRLWQPSTILFLNLKNLRPNQNGDFAISISIICFKLVSFEKFEGFDSNLLKNLKGAFPIREPGSLWELSFCNK